MTEREVTEQAFVRLSLRHQRVLWWKRVDDLSHEEIAECLGISSSKAERCLASTLYSLTLHVEDVRADKEPELTVRLRRRFVEAYLSLPWLAWVWRAGTKLTYLLQTLEHGPYVRDPEYREVMVLIASLGAVMKLGWAESSSWNPGNGPRLSRMIKNRSR